MNLQNIAQFREANGVVVGTVTAVSNDGPVVEFEFDGEAYISLATSVISVSEEDLNCDVALGFSNSKVLAPIILGRMIAPASAGNDAESMLLEGDQVSEEILDLTQKERVTLRCGKASITLTKEGKIILRGTYISSRSSGANRIKGGSVHLN